jgi:hypothetical protein
MTASAIIADVLSDLKGDRLYLAGSLVAEETYGLSDAHSDVDLFCPSNNRMLYTIAKLEAKGYTFADRFDRVISRWLDYDDMTRKWHTNSMKMLSPHGVEVNLVFKKVDGNATRSLSQVLESFDFGLLATGYEVATGEKHDLRPYLFPGMDLKGPLPMLPNKRDNWRNGFVSQYNGLREAGRYAKYYGYGYDMSLVKEDLVTGYWAASTYLASTFDEEKKTMARIYEVIADHISFDNIDHLIEAYKELDFKDDLDRIMEALE